MPVLVAPVGSTSGPRLVSTPPTRADCVVVGGGVLGAATAFYLARRGLSVVVVEKRPRLATLTTAASAGGFRAQQDDPAKIALVRRSIAIFETFAEHTGLPGWDLGLHPAGYLWVTTRADGPERQRRVVEMQRAAGLDDVERLDGDEARRRFPFLAEAVTSARWRARDGWLDPKRLAIGFATASGATFCVGALVHGIAVEGDRVTTVHTDRGSIACGSVVIAAGPLSAKAAALAGLELPLSPMIRHKVAFPQLADVPRDAPMTIDEDTGAHFRPDGAGALALCPEADTTSCEPTFDPPIDHGFAFRLLDPDSPIAVARIAPLWRGVWARATDSFYVASGQYSLTPDRRPILGATPVEGLFLNVGHSGHGIMTSAGASELVARAVVGERAPAIEPFALERGFGGVARHGPL